MSKDEKTVILKEYAQWAESIENGTEEFPLNLEQYCKLIAVNKGHAKRALISKVPDNQFFTSTGKKPLTGRAKETIMTSLEAFEELMQIEHKGFRELMRECRRVLSGTSEMDAADVMTANCCPSHR